MGLEVENCSVNSYSSKLIRYFNKYLSKWCLVPMYYISTLNIPIFPLIFESLNCMRHKLICESQGATFVHRLDFAIMTMNDH
jgi:hypothetical protein